MIRRNADDDEQTLAELVRQEKFGGGSSSQKDMDAEMASRIAGDSKFKVSQQKTNRSSPTEDFAEDVHAHSSTFLSLLLPLSILKRTA